MKLQTLSVFVLISACVFSFWGCRCKVPASVTPKPAEAEPPDPEPVEKEVVEEQPPDPMPPPQKRATQAIFPAPLHLARSILGPDAVSRGRNSTAATASMEPLSLN